MTWTLHPRLAADTHRVASLALSDVLLMDDRQFPWLVLVPRVPDAVEWIDLADADRHALLDEVSRAGHVLRALHAPDKLNVAALGNMVPQLHVHVVARFRGDPAWPRPVWGAVPAERYAGDALASAIERLRTAFA